MLALIGPILSILAPLFIRGIAWVLDYIQAKDQLKREFFMFVAHWEEERGTSVRLSAQHKSQLERVREELAGLKKPDEPPKQ